MRLGILGGTFDPIHLGHLRLAEEMYEELNLSKVLLMPGAQPPHKGDRQVAPFSDRVEMVKIGTQYSGYLDVSDIEGQRKGPSYSIETIRIIRESYGIDLELFFILGSDAFKEIKTWKEYQSLFKITNFIVIERPGITLGELGTFIQSLDAGLNEGNTKNIFLNATGNYVLIKKMSQLDISSTQIRQKIKAGKSINFIVPHKVKEYILEKGLYKK